MVYLLFSFIVFKRRYYAYVSWLEASSLLRLLEEVEITNVINEICYNVAFSAIVYSDFPISLFMVTK